ncbi:hypothetical protein VFPBJ_07824 [Purpureocillium lilacinum]|uniref:Uncharacterized protein n=1 Tax=Purpureocillium lilacinum TaxID=33203 RepID=A0A179GHP1_PURLI|nr:hypothetical protein VFPBJ_07824 [Purpureocillium lilacinum]
MAEAEPSAQVGTAIDVLPASLAHRIMKLLEGQDFLMWLQQLQKGVGDAGLLAYLEDSVARPDKPGWEQVDFDRKRAVVNNVIFESPNSVVQRSVADRINGNLNTVSPRDLVRKVNSDVIWPSLYYLYLSRFTAFPKRYSLSGGERATLKRLHDEWDLLKACERGVSDDVYISTVMGLLDETPHQIAFFNAIIGGMQHFSLAEAEVRSWLKVRFNVLDI